MNTAAGEDSPFTWHKKVTRDKHLNRKPASKDMAQQELEKLRHLRQQRALERHHRDLAHRQHIQDTEEARLGDWKEKERVFHLEQAKRRAEIRVRDGRAVGADVLAVAWRLAWGRGDGVVLDEKEEAAVEELDLHIQEPYDVVDGKGVEEVELVGKDIEMFQELERDQDAVEFWRWMQVVYEDRLAVLREEGIGDPRRKRRYTEAEDVSVMVARTRALPKPIQSDIHHLLSKKTLKELDELRVQVEKKVVMGGPGVDVDYWEQVLRGIVVWKARLKLRDMYKELVRKRGERLRERQREMADREMTSFQREMQRESRVENMSARSKSPIPRKRVDADRNMESATDPRYELEWLEKERQRIRSLDFVPLIRKQCNPPVQRPTPVKQDKESRLKQMEQEILRRLEADELIEQAATYDDFTEQEETLTSEPISLTSSYAWSSHYAPRKPRYINKVQTGYEWNKYNQTHYDHDNPPPKIVQGYKFNLFYPDLVDPTQSPTYKLIPENEDTSIILFSSGPPYEDIAFRIVNKEWERSHKYGFRCKFDRGVLQLHFRFRKRFYKR